MLDDILQAFRYAFRLITDFTEQISREDVTALLVSYAVAASAIVLMDVVPKLASWSRAKAVNAVRTYVEDLFDGYARRFTARGFTFPTCKYSLWLAFAVWLHAFLILSAWPTWEGLGIVALSALAVVLTLSVLGYNTSARNDRLLLRGSDSREP